MNLEARLATMIEEVSGNVIPEQQQRFLLQVARRRARHHKLESVERYVDALASGELVEEWSVLLPEVTVNESYCFRAPHQLAALTAQVLPELVRRRSTVRRLRIWSAGCARGEEPATLAILLAECSLLAGWQWEIVATDVDRSALADARRARYGRRAVSKVPRDLLERYFSACEEAHELVPSLRRRIHYRLENLLEVGKDAERFDLIFLRNVLIYFRPEVQVRVMEQLTRRLADDGFLFLGPSETLWQVTDRFLSVDLGMCFAYAIQDDAAVRSSPKARSAQQPQASDGGAGRPRRSRSVSRQRSAESEAGARPGRVSPEGPRPSLAAAVSALLDNRFEEAVHLVKELIACGSDLASAHVVAGLIHEVDNRLPEAIGAYRAALYLIPELYQVRILLADLLRRRGETRRAQSEYRQVIRLLLDGSAREIEELRDLPLADHHQAMRRSRAALERC